MEKETVITLIKDIEIGILNLNEYLEKISGETKSELQNLITEMEMTKAWLKDYHSISNDDISFEN